MPELKPCPFCGGKAVVEKYARSYGEYFVHCVNSFCRVQPCSFIEDTEEEAIESWNRRAKDD